MPGDLTVGERSLPDFSRGEGDWRLDVVDGPNRGARLDLPPGAYRIGAEADADILLADQEAGRIRLHLTIPEAGEARVLAEAPGALVAGRPLRPGRARLVSRGATVRLGATTLRLAPPPAGLAARDGRRRAMQWRVGLLAALILLLGATAVLLPRLMADPRPAVTERRDVGPRADRAPPDPEAARAALSERLAAAGLGPDRLRVSDGAGGALLVEGRLSAEETARFNDVRRWYDAAHGAGPALVPRLGVDIGPPRPGLRIRAVSLAPVPYIIASDGEKYGEGAVLEDGWVVESITRERVVLRRGSETSVVTL
ncbi:FHA domain-containing protein [Roseomonas sp. CCTCC AB2023176]|uniref:SctD/MshK family protein n=1 Tax=Roseomonas sp. CCTCC AB2023176 TaxID=3342640 RepID=UPI0035DB51F8